MAKTDDVFVFIGTYPNEAAARAAGTLIVIAPVMVVYMIFQRQFIAGAIKG